MRRRRRTTSVLIPPTACCPGHYLENLKHTDERRLRAQKAMSVAAFGELDDEFEFLKDYPEPVFSKDDNSLQKRSISQNLKSLLGVSFRLNKNYLKINSAFGHYGR